MTDAAGLSIGGVAEDSAPVTDGAVLSIGGGSWGINEDQFFSGNQPVFTNQPDPVQVDPTQPASANWPGPNVVAPTNTETYDPITPPTKFVGNQPVEDEPPSQVDVGHGQPGSANWPEAPWYEEPPPENPG